MPAYKVTTTRATIIIYGHGNPESAKRAVAATEGCPDSAILSVDEMAVTEDERKAAFKACPILADYLATALQDLQYSESDEACTDEREARDSGTIYDCPVETFDAARRDCEAFMAANAAHIESALELVPGEDGLRYGRVYVTYERIGSRFYLQRVGHGVGFTDDGDANCLKAMGEYARSHSCESLYLGDDGKAYWG